MAQLNWAEIQTPTHNTLQPYYGLSSSPTNKFKYHQRKEIKSIESSFIHRCFLKVFRGYTESDCLEAQRALAVVFHTDSIASLHLDESLPA